MLMCRRYGVLGLWADKNQMFMEPWNVFFHLHCYFATTGVIKNLVTKVNGGVPCGRRGSKLGFFPFIECLVWREDQNEPNK
jgi:hypothetical protein